MPISILKILAIPNKLVFTFILNLILGSLLFNYQPRNFLQQVVFLMINFVVIYGISFITERIAKLFYKPQFYNRNKMTMQNVIEQNTTSWGKYLPVVSDADYKLRSQLEFTQIHMITTMVFLFFTYGFLSLGKIYLLNLFNINISTFDFLTGLTAFVYFIIYLLASFSSFVWYNGVRNNIPKDVTIFSVITVLLYVILLTLALWQLIV